MALKIGQVLDRRYRIDSLLGQGGFGAVYKAWDLSLDRACAVKENLDTSDVARRQFTREATVLASLSHTNLPRVTDHFFIPGFGQYLVMDFVDGIDLGQLVRNDGPVPPERALKIIRQIADALEYLHSRKPPVLHRDIKPGNIKITPDGTAVLVDFGLVKMYGPQLETTMGARAVTPGYSPPEQYGQGTTDPRTDVYALSATLYTLLTARLPPESVQRYGSDDLVLPHQVDNSISPVVSAAVGRGMALNPTQRFQSVADMRAVLWPDTTVPTPRPAGRGGSWLWIIVGAVLILVCLGAAATATLGSALALPFLFGGTATPTPEPTEGALLFRDAFDDNSSGWQVGANEGGQLLFDNDQFVIQVSKTGWEVASNPAITDLSNLHIHVTASSTGVAGNEGFGIVCDYLDKDNFYFLGITPDGYYAIVKKEAGSETVLTDPTNNLWDSSARFVQNQDSYLIGADCAADGQLTLRVDNAEIATVNDSTFTSGQIGLLVRTFDTVPAEVVFDDMRVTALP